jgi:glycosyltransferase involved in cell wall biosynthesis
MTAPKALIWYWGRLGGGPQMTELLVGHLIERGFGPQLALSLSARNERLDRFEQFGLEQHFIETFERTPNVVGLMQQVPRLRGHFRSLLAAARPDVVVVPMIFGALVPLIDLVTRSRARLVYVVHDATPHPGDNHAVGIKMTQRVLLHLADDIVTMSEAVRDQLCRSAPGVAAKVRTERLVGLFKPAANARCHPAETPRFLMPGRLVSYKGYERLAEALKLMDRNDFTVTISGDGPYRDKVAELFGSDPRVRLDLSWRTPEEHEELFGSHDVVLCPYSEASQSAVICEALSIGLPTIVTPVGALPEQIGFGRGGIVLQAMTAQALADAMSAIVNRKFDYAAASMASLELLRTEASRLTWHTLMSK